MNTNPSPRNLRFTIACLGILVLAALYFLVGVVWKISCLNGQSTGMYALFLFADRTALPLAALSAFAAVLSFTLWCVQITVLKGCELFWGRNTLILFLASLLLGIVIVNARANPLTLVDTARVDGKVYYLTSYPSGAGKGYSLLECDQQGIFCKGVYNTGSSAKFKSHSAELIYNTLTGELSIKLVKEGIIYTIKHP